jgi:high-affinity nickel-transport protein
VHAADALRRESFVIVGTKWCLIVAVMSGPSSEFGASVPRVRSRYTPIHRRDRIGVCCDHCVLRGGFGTVYALGHAAVVLALGTAAVLAGSRLPPSIDALMGRIAGVTLLVLAAVVLVAVVRDRGEFRATSRWLLLIGHLRSLARRVPRTRRGAETVVHAHDHVAVPKYHHDGDDRAAMSSQGTRTKAPVHGHAHVHHATDAEYTGKMSFAIGMLHGAGAETPTQLLVFLAAANAGGTATGLAVLVVFVTGLLVSNTVVTFIGANGFGLASARPAIQISFALATVAISVLLGISLLLGHDAPLPSLIPS